MIELGNLLGRSHRMLIEDIEAIGRFYSMEIHKDHSARILIMYPFNEGEGTPIAILLKP